MRTFVVARGVALAGLAAASATAAHGGAAAIADPAWSLPALAAASAGVAALLRLVHAAGATRAAAARVRQGATRAVHTPLGFAETAAVMLAAQGGAHLALIAAGAPTHSGQTGALALQTGALALHTGLALLATVVVWAADRGLAAALDELDAAIAAAAELLLTLAPPHRLRPAAAPAGRARTGAHRGRAPPTTA